MSPTGAFSTTPSVVYQATLAHRGHHGSVPEYRDIMYLRCLEWILVLSASLPDHHGGGRQIAIRRRHFYMLDRHREPSVVSDQATHMLVFRRREHQLISVHNYDAVQPRYLFPGNISLYDYITHEEEISDRLIYAWMMQFCYGMEYAYSKGLTAHRDIKPKNTLIGKGPFLKIADFGLATTISSAAQFRPAREKITVSGTPGYIAPELFLGERRECAKRHLQFRSPALAACFIFRHAPIFANSAQLQGNARLVVRG